MNYEQCRAQAISDLASYNYLKISLSTLPPQIELSQSVGAVAVPQENEQSRQLRSRLETNILTLRCIEAALDSLTEEERELITSYYISRQRSAAGNFARKSYTHRSCVYRRIHRALDSYILAYFGVAPPKGRAKKQP